MLSGPDVYVADHVLVDARGEKCPLAGVGQKEVNQLDNCHDAAPVDGDEQAFIGIQGVMPSPGEHMGVLQVQRVWARLGHRVVLHEGISPGSGGDVASLLLR